MNRWSKAVFVIAVLASVVSITAWTVKRTDTPPEKPRAVGDVVPQKLEQLFVPVTPCRIADTRKAGGALGDLATRNYVVGGTTQFVPQGGKSGGCDIPPGAKAVAATVTSVSATGTGFIRAYPTGGSEPTATLLNFSTVNTGTSSVLPIRSGAGAGLTLRNHGSTTHVVIDVNGYYIPQMQAYISPAGAIANQSGRLVSATLVSTGVYKLIWDRDVSDCTGQASSDITGHVESVYTSNDISYVYVVDNAGNAANYWMNVTINC